MFTRIFWSPVREELLLVKQETNNSHDSSAVASMKENVVLGHIPHNLAPEVIILDLNDLEILEKTLTRLILRI